MPATLVHASRPKLLVMTLGSAVTAVLFLVVGLTGEPLVLIAIPILGLVVMAGVRALGRREAALIIDESGMEDTRAGIRLNWDEVESMRLWSSWRLIMRRSLLVKVRDLEAIEDRMRAGVHRRLARASRRMGFQTLEISLNMLSMGYRKIIEAIRLHSGGVFPGPRNEGA
jgi:hypothetical protein